MRRARVLLAVLTAASVTVACTGTSGRDAATTAAPASTEPSLTEPAVSEPPDTEAAVDSTGTPTRAVDTTGPAATDTTPASATPPWQQFPTAPVPVLRRSSIRVLNKVNTTDPVVFLTIDDGFEQDPRVPALLAQHQAPATLFLIAGPVTKATDYFRRFLDIGGSINSHTLHHAHLPGMSPEAQQAEICGQVSTIKFAYGKVGYFFRPPRGEYDSNTLVAAQKCGVRAVILWRVVVTGSTIDTWGTNPIQRGDIILLHFLTTTYDSLVMLFAELDRLGLKVARLEDYLPAA